MGGSVVAAAHGRLRITWLPQPACYRKRLLNLAELACDEDHVAIT